MTIQIDDYFCGVGGGGTGAERATAAPIKVRTAANHNPIAVELYKKNHPWAEVRQDDLCKSNPKKYPKGAKGAIFSPDCTTFSGAFSTKELRDDSKPIQLVLDLYTDDQMTVKERQSRWDKMSDKEKREALLRSERSRQTPLQCYKFIKHLKYDFCVIENVPLFLSWRLFRDWKSELEELGYRSKIVSFNSASTGTIAQSRDRIFIVLWKQNLPTPKLDYQPQCFCPKCDRLVLGKQSFKKPDVKVGRYGRYGQYWYRCVHCWQICYPLAIPAWAIIDWSKPCKPIGNGKRLVENTRNRIAQGLRKYGTQPLLCNTHFDGYVWHTSRPCPTQTTRQTLAVVTPPDHPHWIDQNYSKGAARSINQPLSTVTTSGAHHGLVSMPENAHFLTSFYGRKDTSSSMHNPVPTVVASPKHALVQSPFLTKYNGNGSNHSIEQPTSTLTTKDRLGLVLPNGSTLDLDDPQQLNQAVSLCGFRMLIDQEVGRASGFPEDYIVTGNNRTNIALYGQAITPDAVTWIFNDLIQTFYC